MKNPARLVAVLALLAGVIVSLTPAEAQRAAPARSRTATNAGSASASPDPASQGLVLTFSKAFSPSTIGPGSVSTLQFSIGNTNQGTPAGEVAFTDNLPPGMTVAPSPNVVSSCNGTLSAPAGGSSVALTDGQVPAGGACAISVDVTSGTVGANNNVSGAVSSDIGNGGTASATLTVGTDRPGLSKSFSPATVLLGGRSTLTLTIDNSANASGASNLTVSDALPPGMEIAAPSNSATTCGGGNIVAPPGLDVISYGPNFFGDATVGASASCTISVDVIGAAAGTLNNVTGDLTSTPPVGGTSRSSGSASAALTVSREEISLSKSFTDDPVAPGGTVELEFTVRNLAGGTSFNGRTELSLSNIAFTDDLDAALSGLVATSPLPSNPCGSGSALSGTSTLSLTGGSLGPGESCTFGVSLAVPSAAATGAYTNTTSSITADTSLSTMLTGSAASDVLFVQPIPTLTKQFTDDPVGSGGSVTLEFTVTNTSPSSTATNIAFIDELTDAGLSTGFLPFPVSVTLPPTPDPPCGAGSSLALVSLDTERQGLSLTGGTLSSAQSCTFSVVVDIPLGFASGSYTNTTREVTATIDGATFTGNPASDTVDVLGGPLLTKEFVGGPSAAGGPATLRFTLFHDAQAPADATGIEFTDDLEAALSGLTATLPPSPDPPCGSGSALAVSGVQNLEFTGGTLAPGATCSFDVALTTPSTATPGAHTNTTSTVMATVAGETATSDPASADLQIAGITITKEFTDDPVLPGGQVTLEFTVQNLSATDSATEITFQDDLNDTLSGLTVTGLPQNDVCGTGSLLSLTAGVQNMALQNGTLAASASCVFSVTLNVPGTAAPGVYRNRTNSQFAKFGGPAIAFDPGIDDLVVADLLSFSKDFTDDPVAPGGTATLEFTIVNLSSQAVANINFTDDLDAVVPGLVATGLPAAGCGGAVSGTSTISLTGGSLLAAPDSCTFSVTVNVPNSAPLGLVATNITSQIAGDVGGATISGDPAVTQLNIDLLQFSKEFTDDPVDQGASATLRFNISNPGTDPVSGLTFTDDLAAVLPGLVATGLPLSGVCGAGSQISGVSVLTLTGGNLLGGGSCTFDVTVQVPASATPDTYTNTTSELIRGGDNFPVADPATDGLVVTQAPLDSDGDTVLDVDDVCPNTVIPEATVPSQGLGTNRHALGPFNNDTIFDTKTPGRNGGIQNGEFNIQQTAGCSCEQIIAEEGLGQGHTKFGCSKGAIEDWIDQQ